MNSSGIFKIERKGYCCEQVDEFLRSRNEEHEEALAEKDAEIKRMFSENEELKERLAAAVSSAASAVRDAAAAREAAEAAKAEANNARLSGENDRDAVNARIGEKLSAAEDAAKALLDKTKAECDAMKEECRGEIVREIANAHDRAEKACENARRIADVYEEKQQLVASGIEQSRRHLDDAVRAVDEILGSIK